MEVRSPLITETTRLSLMVFQLNLYLTLRFASGFYALQLDRSNISNALTQTLATNLDMTSIDANLGQQLMRIGTLVADIPVVLDDPTKASSKFRTQLRSVCKAIADCRPWIHCALDRIALAPRGGIQLCTSSVMQSVGFDVVFMAFAISWAYATTRLRRIW